MPFAWMLNVVWIALATIAVVVLLSRLFKAKFPFHLIVAVFLTLLVSQGLIYWLNNPELPTLTNLQRTVWLAIAFLLGLSTILRAIKWLLLELLVNRRAVKI